MLLTTALKRLNLAAVPYRLLSDYSGYLMTDGYASYDRVGKKRRYGVLGARTCHWHKPSMIMRCCCLGTVIPTI